MNTASIQDFIEQAPWCIKTDALSTLIKRFSQDQAGQVVIVDSLYQPKGIVYLHHWFPYLLQISRLSSADSTSDQALDKNIFSNEAVAPHSHASVAKLPLNAQFSIQEAAEVIQRATGQQMLIDVAIAPQSLTISEFQAQTPIHVGAFLSIPSSFTQSSDPSAPAFESGFERVAESSPSSVVKGEIRWSIVDEEGRYLGLLDERKLWRSVSTTSRPDQTLSTSQAPSPLDNTVESLTEPLIGFIHLLPVPLMLQTAEGQIIAQNKEWLQHVGELKDPRIIRQHAASILNVADSAPEAADSLDLAAFPADALMLCRPGIDSDSCVCVCPMKNGQERVWQFVKLPVGQIPLSVLQSRAQADVQSDLRHLPHPLWSMKSRSHSSRTASSMDSTARDSDGMPFYLAQLNRSNESFQGDRSPHCLAQRIPQREAQKSKPEIWLMLALDVTEQTQLTKELTARNADLVQSNRLKDEFLACITHELKTPLTAILGLSSLLKDQTIGELNERQNRYAQLIYQSGRRLALIVNDILDLTRIETKQLTLHCEQVNIRSVCEHAYKEALQLRDGVHPFNSTEVEQRVPSVAQFTLDIQPGLQQIVADELRLRQMLAHLLSNAFKFTNAAGTTGLRVRRWESWIAFTVWDTGIGIPVDKQHLIFQKFQQLENPLTRKFEGTGLGLALTQKLAQLHGGDITFTSTESQGSEFTLLLPPQPPQSLQPDETHTVVREDAMAIAPLSVGNRLAVIVDADADALERLSHQLAKLGYRFAIARSGPEALGKIRRLQPKVIFLNPVLPLLSGWDTLTLLKADSTTQHIPVIVTMTSLESEQTLANGADATLTQPIHLRSLQQALNDVLDDSPMTRSPESLTVLYLNPDETLTSHAASQTSEFDDEPQAERSSSLTTEELNAVLHPYHCRVIEVDDLPQAELLSRVWKPDVILLSHSISEPFECLDLLSRSTTLSALPIVTLTPEMAEVANRFPDLKVFPCFDLNQATHDSKATRLGLSPLIQVLRVATDSYWTPHVLLVHAIDFGEMNHFEEDETSRRNTLNTSVPTHRRDTSHLQISAQYLRAAGLRSSLASSFEDTMHRIEHHSADVVIVYCFSAYDLPEQFVPRLEALRRRDLELPILIWLESPAESSVEAQRAIAQPVIETALQELGIQQIPAGASIGDVFSAINAVLTHRFHSTSP